MTTRYLLVADPVSALNPRFDLGVLLSQELLRRAIQLDYLDVSEADVGLPSERFLAGLPVRPIERVESSRMPFWELGPLRRAGVEEYRVILQRKDPPVDERYVAFHRHFAAAPAQIVQINRPPAIYELSEHTVILRYPEFAAPTRVCASYAELEEAVRAQAREAVCKPKSMFCGIGIAFFSPDAPADQLREYWQRWRPEVVVQPYLEAIETSGDLRILTIGEKVLGSVLRVPAEGSRLANLHRGARAAAMPPTPRQLEACRVVAEDLNPLGLHLLGLDFIGEHLTEVNITSPTTLTQINQVNGIRADVDLVDELERMWRERA